MNLDRMESRRIHDPRNRLTDMARVLGCPQCRSTCPQLDHCVVCRGESRCARCLYGPGVTDDERHAVLTFDG